MFCEFDFSYLNLKKQSPRPIHAKQSESICRKWLKNIRPNIYRLRKRFSKKKKISLFKMKQDMVSRLKIIKFEQKKEVNQFIEKNVGF